MDIVYLIWLGKTITMAIKTSSHLVFFFAQRCGDLSWREQVGIEPTEEASNPSQRF